VHQQSSYLKDTIELKTLLSNLHLPNNALLVTCDAKSMYTNIKKIPALHEISIHLQHEEGVSFMHYKADTLIEAIHSVFQNNIVKFGDTCWKQILGTEMDIAPATPSATIFLALYKDHFLPAWATNILFYKDYIDDVTTIIALCMMPIYGPGSNRTCKSGRSLNENSPSAPAPVTSWIDMSQEGSQGYKPKTGPKWTQKENIPKQRKFKYFTSLKL
jgi:hypothetical protein